MTQNGSTMDRGATGGLYPSRSHSQQLPYSSRAFDMFMSRTPLNSLPPVDILASGRASPGATSPSARPSSIPRPSYLQGSHYLARLEQQARQRTLQAQRQRQDSQEKNGSSLPGDKTASQPQHLGIARDVVERTPPHEDDDLIDSLPSRWSNVKEDRATGLDVLSDGLEVKYTGPRDPNERDHEARAIRADQPMPARCGLYYYEVTILGRKHNE